jgi:hypothetical protein
VKENTMLEQPLVELHQTVVGQFEGWDGTNPLKIFYSRDNNLIERKEANPRMVTVKVYIAQ